ncbi:MAG TPA: hypothetical protein VGC49_05815 [Solirubrobacterales bacterium]|jgi:hypothetical protein
MNALLLLFSFAVVALLGAAEGSEDVAIGAIVGAPFLVFFLVLFAIGGLLAYESLHLSRRFRLPAVIGWFCLYTAFIAAVVAGA